MKCLRGFFGHDEPLGMPKGSVRATLAIMLIAAVIALAFLLVFVKAASAEIALGLLTLATVVVKDYFEVRRNGQ